MSEVEGTQFSRTFLLLEARNYTSRDARFGDNRTPREI